MYITLELLQQRGACQEALDFFAKHKPDGVEMMEAITKMHLPYSFLHWGYQYLDPNEEEIAAYLDKVKVVRSQGVHESDNITDSYCISGSHNVNKSEFIYSSKEVQESEKIYNSEFIIKSDLVWDSFMVEHSTRVSKSKNVYDSNEVLESVYVNNSHGIFKSEDVVHSSAIWSSRNLTNCGFCARCENLSNALFCDKVADGEYYLFNKPISKERFDRIYQQYNSTFFKPHIVLMTPTYNKKSPPYPYNDYRKHFTEIPESFWRWVSTLPGYDPSILYSLTFNPQFLN